MHLAFVLIREISFHIGNLEFTTFSGKASLDKPLEACKGVTTPSGSVSGSFEVLPFGLPLGNGSGIYFGVAQCIPLPLMLDARCVHSLRRKLSAEENCDHSQNDFSSLVYNF